MKEIEPFSMEELYLPMYRYYKQGVYSTHVDSKSDILYKGYRGQDKKWDGTEFSKISTYHFNRNEKIEKEFDLFLCQLI